MATTIDFSPLIPSLSTVILSVLAVAAGLALLAVAQRGVLTVLAMIRGTTVTDMHYQKRYKQEQKRRAYRDWKKAKGYK